MNSTPQRRLAAALGLGLGMVACAEPATVKAEAKQRLSAVTAAPAAIALPAPDTAAARKVMPPDTKLELLDFPAKGTRTVRTHMSGYATMAYVVPAASGQTLHVSFKSNINANYFNLYDAANPQPPLFTGATAADSSTATVTAARATTYVIQVYLMRVVARRGTVASYTLTVTRE